MCVSVVCEGVITEFLSHIHLNIVVGLQSQEFAYSHLSVDVVPLCNVPTGKW